MAYGRMIKVENVSTYVQLIPIDWQVLESNVFQNVHQTPIFMQMMTVEIVNQFALWINLPIQLTESVNLNVYLCSNTISDVYHFVQLDIMPIQLVTVWCQLYVTQVYLMERMEQLSALLLVQ